MMAVIVSEHVNEVGCSTVIRYSSYIGLTICTCI